MQRPGAFADWHAHLQTEVVLLSACLHVLPARDGLKDQEYRYRHRWVDLIINPRVRSTFHTRAKIITFVRQVRGY